MDNLLAAVLGIILGIYIGGTVIEAALVKSCIYHDYCMHSASTGDVVWKADGKVVP